MDNSCNNSNNDSNSSSQNRKVILRPRVILDGDLLEPIFTPSNDNLENDSGVGSLQARIRDSIVSAPSPSPVNCNPSTMHTYFRQSLIN